MYCKHCGNQVEPSSRFCPSCGASISSAPPPPPAAGFYPDVTKLTRPRDGRMIAGVCAGFALHYGWDLNLVRIVTALIVILTGVGAIAYLAAWVIIPEAPYTMPVKST
jgi:phage shock protein C